MSRHRYGVARVAERVPRPSADYRVSASTALSLAADAEKAGDFDLAEEWFRIASEIEAAETAETRRLAELARVSTREALLRHARRYGL